MIRWILCLSFLLSHQAVFAKTWRVTVNGRQTIQSAIDAAQAGDTIVVEAGTYKQGNITVSKALTLTGINYPVLDGENKHEIVSIKANYVTVEGFELRNSGRSSMNDVAAIKLYDAQRCVVRNNKLREVFFGIYNNFARNCVIE